MSSYIHKLIEEGEHQQLDFKFAINDAAKIAKTFSAFANTDGGRLLIGVKDNGVVAGIRSEEEYYMIESASQLYTAPEVPFEARPHTVDGKQVLEVYIHKGSQRPYKAKEQDKWLAYIRNKDQNFLANIVLLKLWEKERNTKGALIRYRDEEKALLIMLQTKQQISISAFARKMKMHRNRVIDILATLIHFRLVGYNVNEKGFHYFLNDSEYTIETKL